MDWCKSLKKSRRGNLAREFVANVRQRVISIEVALGKRELTQEGEKKKTGVLRPKLRSQKGKGERSVRCAEGVTKKRESLVRNRAGKRTNSERNKACHIYRGEIGWD